MGSWIGFELGQHHEQPLEGGEVREACDPKEVKVVRCEALLPPVADDALHDAGARCDTDARTHEHHGVVLEAMLRRRAW